MMMIMMVIMMVRSCHYRTDDDCGDGDDNGDDGEGITLPHE